jgi:hypothetical protein
MGAAVVLNWFWIADQHFSICSSNMDDEDLLRVKDTKANIVWERVFWSFTYALHGQHASAFGREIKFFTHHPDDPKINYKCTYNVRNPYAIDRYYKGFGKMRDMRLL